MRCARRADARAHRRGGRRGDAAALALGARARKAGGHFPAYAPFLARSDDVSGYLEYPTYGNYRDGEWMHNQTLHWKPLANGYSARIAGSYRRVADLFDPFPDRGELARLRRQRISRVVFHWQESPRRRSRAGQKLLLARIQAATTAGSLEPVYQDAVTSVYRIVAGDPERLAAPGG